MRGRICMRVFMDYYGLNVISSNDDLRSPNGEVRMTAFGVKGQAIQD